MANFAIKEVFPDSHIIFCRVHIGKNIRDKVGIEMAHVFKEVFSGKMAESEFLDVCEQHIANNNGTKSSKFLEKLLTQKEHWLPSLTGTYVHLDNQTTNRVEGFFGTLKNLLEHNIQTLANVVRAMYNRAERLSITAP